MRAQFDSAAVLGTIRNTRGAVISGASVTLKRTTTNLSATATINAQGDFAFPLVQDRRLLTEYVVQIESAAQVIELGLPEFCSFHDMYRFNFLRYWRT